MDSLLPIIIAVVVGAVVLFVVFSGGKPTDAGSTEAEPAQPMLDKKAEKAAAKAKASAERREKEKAAAIARKKEQAAAEKAAAEDAAAERAVKAAADEDKETKEADTGESAACDTSPGAIISQLESAGFSEILVSDGQVCDRRGMYHITF